MLQSDLYCKKLLKTQNPQLINKSGFKSRAAYNGARTVDKNDVEFIVLFHKLQFFEIELCAGTNVHAVHCNTSRR